MKKEQIQFGSKTIEFGLSYTDRKTLGITVTPEMEVEVKAPTSATMDQIKEKVHKRASWILKQQNYFLTFHPKSPPKQYLSGETHLYLGRRYRLKIQASDTPSVKLKGKYLNISTPDHTQAKTLLKAWYLTKAHKKFHEYAQPLINQFQTYQVTPEQIVLRNMPTRWGSCTPKGKIILNPELIKAPKGCIEYVIIHELCHLVHPNHTRQFFNLQTKEMPQWERWKERLERLMV